MPIPTPSATNVVLLLGAVRGEIISGGGGGGGDGVVTFSGRGGGSTSSAGDGGDIGAGADPGGGKDITGVQLVQIFRGLVRTVLFERAVGLTHAEHGKPAKRRRVGCFGD